MAEFVEIVPLNNSYCGKIIDLILPIQQVEFNVPVTLEGQPDMLDIERHYHQTGGGFWGAVCNGRLVGTIALIGVGHNTGVIRKMFVHKNFRGKEKGVAQNLMRALLRHCADSGINHLYLGTVGVMKAAQRFYEKNGFVQIEKESLPPCFLFMPTDTLFYELHLK